MSDIETLPAGWTRANLADVIAARTERVKPQDFPNLPFVGLGNIEAQSMRLLKAAIASEVKSSCFRFRSGDVLYSRLRPYLNKVTQPSFDGVCSAELIVLQPSGVLTSDFLQYRLNAADFVEFASGLNAGDRPRVDLTEIGRFETLIPPAREQKRISDRIKSLLANLECGMSGLAQAMANLSRYQEAVLHSAVTGSLTAEWRAANPAKEDGKALLERILRERRERWEKEQLASFAAKGKQPPKGWREKYEEPPAPDTTQLPELPEEWAWASIDQLLASLRNGYFASPCPGSDGTPILRINAVRPMRVDLDEVRHLDVTPESDLIADFLIEDGDLLFTRYNGSRDFVGVAGMVRGCVKKILHPDKLIRVALLEKGSHPAFVEICANTGSSRRHILSKARTTAGQTGVSGADIRQMPIPLPSLEEQDRIASVVGDRLQELLRAQKTLDEQIARAGELRQSILKAAFEGRLVPQDPNDEPASTLLERIKAKSSAAASTKTKITKRRKAAAK